MSKSKKLPYVRAKALITPQQMTRIRALAREYVLAGGGLVPADNDADVSDYIANVRTLWRPRVEEAFETALARAVPESDHPDDHGALWMAGWELVGSEGEAGFLLGVAVGLEVGGIGRAFGVLPPQLGGDPRITPRRRSRKGGAQ